MTIRGPASPDADARAIEAQLRAFRSGDVLTPLISKEIALRAADSAAHRTSLEATLRQLGGSLGSGMLAEILGMLDDAVAAAHREKSLAHLDVSRISPAVIRSAQTFLDTRGGDRSGLDRILAAQESTSELDALMKRLGF